jgi:hypothetical protein
VAHRPRNPHQIMATTTAFELNQAIQQWRERLTTSPQFQAEEISELESHLRDSVITLQANGLSPEESFLIASRRVGTVEQIEPEFRKVKLRIRPMLPFVLTLILLWVGCFFLWGMLLMPRMMVGNTGIPLPSFSVMMMSLKSWLVVPPIVALAYCCLACFRRTAARPAWTGFFATTVSFLIIMALPIIVAIFLPLIDRLNRIPGSN